MKEGRRGKKPGSSLTGAEGKKIEVRKTKEELLREVTVKIGFVLGDGHAQKKKPSTGKMWKMLKERGNILQCMQI